jgi:hypothetical protein
VVHKQIRIFPGRLVRQQRGAAKALVNLAAKGLSGCGSDASRCRTLKPDGFLVTDPLQFSLRPPGNCRRLVPTDSKIRRLSNRKHCSASRCVRRESWAQHLRSILLFLLQNVVTTRPLRLPSAESASLAAHQRPRLLDRRTHRERADGCTSVKRFLVQAADKLPRRDEDVNQRCWTRRI